jgi:hypothetical protein
VPGVFGRISWSVQVCDNHFDQLNVGRNNADNFQERSLEEGSMLL